uniref:COesterase domain-containing protein n=1 Tax=Macrostomum lignano TaxID=282301 RepID=A0A1I8FG36_9PLAT
AGQQCQHCSTPTSGREITTVLLAFAASMLFQQFDSFRWVCSGAPARSEGVAGFYELTPAKFPLIALVNFGNGHSTDLTLPGPEAPMAAGQPQMAGL